MKYKEAVAVGLGLLDSHFEQVEVLESSDSDEEPSHRYVLIASCFQLEYHLILTNLEGFEKRWPPNLIIWYGLFTLGRFVRIVSTDIQSITTYGRVDIRQNWLWLVERYYI